MVRWWCDTGQFNYFFLRQLFIFKFIDIYFNINIIIYFQKAMNEVMNLIRTDRKKEIMIK